MRKFWNFVFIMNKFETRPPALGLKMKAYYYYIDKGGFQFCYMLNSHNALSKS